jgi:hypothetical protein
MSGLARLGLGYQHALNAMDKFSVKLEAGGLPGLEPLPSGIVAHLGPLDLNHDLIDTWEWYMPGVIPSIRQTIARMSRNNPHFFASRTSSESSRSERE